MAAPVLQFKRGLLANLPGLRAGEPGFTTDSYDLYVGIDSSLANNKFFGSHRYWTKETTSTGSGINIVEGTSNGSSYITLKAPDSLVGIVTYTLPGTDGTTNQVLATNGSGTLSFIDPVTQLDIAGDSGTDSVDLLTDTFSIIGTTAEIVTAVTNNQVQIGLPDNVIVGASLTVTGALDVNGGADISGGETVLSSATVSDLTSGRVILAGTSGALEDSGNLTFDGSTLTVTGEIVVNSGISTFTGLIDANDGLDVVGGSTFDNINVTGISTFGGLIDGNSGANISGQTELENLNVSVAATFASATVSDLTSGRVVLAGTGGNLEDSANLTFDGTTLGILSQVSVGTGGTIFTATSEGKVGIGSAIPVGTLDIVVPAGDAEVLIKSTDGVSSDADARLTLDAGNGGEGEIVFNYQGVTESRIQYRNDVNTLSIESGVNIDLQTGGGSTLLLDGSGNADLYGSLAIGTGALVNNPTLTVGTGVGITQFSAAVGTGGSTTSVPTSSAVIDYVNVVAGNVDLTLGLDADTGGPSTVSTAQTLTISGTANEVNTSVSGQTVTVGLPDSVTVTTALTTPTVNVTNVRANDGTAAITITDATGAVATSGNLTVGGDLFVNGSTTQVNTASLTVEDRTIDLGIVNGSAPASATTWDLGVLFNYFDTSAKKSGVIWEHSATRFQFASTLTSETGSTDVNNPQIVTATFAPIEIGALWVTDCAGTSQVISCTGTERFLENITVDAGTF